MGSAPRQWRPFSWSESASLSASFPPVMAVSTPIGRPRRSRLYIVIGTALALLAFLAAAALASAPYLFPATGSGTKVGVAKNNITAPTPISSSDLEPQSVTPTPPHSFQTLTPASGKGP